MPLPHGPRAFRHRDYRLYCAGQGTSQIGAWLQLIAVSRLVYRLSGSAFLLGLAGFALNIPLRFLVGMGVILIRPVYEELGIFRK